MSDNSEWEQEVQRECIDKMAGMNLVTAIFNGTVDWKIAIEIGSAVLYDKPIVLLITPGVKVPNHLVTIAAEIVEFDMANPAEAQRRMSEAILRLKL